MRAHRLAVLAVLVVALMALAAPAFAAGSGEEPPVVNPKPPVEEPRQEPKLEPKVEGERTVLPFTGSDLTLFVLAGGLTVAVGAAMVGRARVRGAEL
jgi:hypothetical protein